MRKSKLSNSQIMTLTASAMLSGRLLNIQQELVSIAKQDAWISAFLGGLLAIASGLGFHYVARMYPKNDLPEILLSIFGKIIGRVFIIPFMIFLLIYIGLITRIFCEALKILLLHQTPLIIIAVIFVLTIISVTKRGISTIAGVIDITLPSFILVLILLLLLSFREVQLINMRPILFENTKNVMKASIVSYGTFMGFAGVSYFLCYTKSPKSTIKWYVGGVLLPTIIFTILVLMTILVFGSNEIMTMIYPTLTLSKAIEFPITLLERLEVFIILIWIPAVFNASTVAYFSSTRNILVFFKIDKRYKNYIIFAQAPLIIFICCFAENTLEIMRYTRKIESLGIILGLVFTPFLASAAFLHSRRKIKQ